VVNENYNGSKIFHCNYIVIPSITSSREDKSEKHKEEEHRKIILI